LPDTAFSQVQRFAFNGGGRKKNRKAVGHYLTGGVDIANINLVIEVRSYKTDPQQSVGKRRPRTHTFPGMSLLAQSPERSKPLA
jgi:hypothetical protein